MIEKTECKFCKDKAVGNVKDLLTDSVEKRPILVKIDNRYMLEPLLRLAVTPDGIGYTFHFNDSYINYCPWCGRKLQAKETVYRDK